MAPGGGEGSVTVSISNIGGISRSTVKLEKGVNILAGENASNRTSFLRSLMAALGSEKTYLKADKDEGEVTITNEETKTKYSRQLIRDNGTVRFEGNPYITDTLLPDLFAFLLEDNESRQTVKQNGDLGEIITRPIDLDDIKSQLSNAKRERDKLKKRLENIEGLSDKLVSKKQKLEKIKKNISSTKGDLEQKQEELQAKNGNESGKTQPQDELEEVLESLNNRREELDTVQYQIETEEESLEALRDRQHEITTELFQLRTPNRDITEIEDEISALRKKKQSVERKINQVQDLINFNEEMIDDGPDDFIESQLMEAHPSRSVTDKLVSEKTICWTCGHEVETDYINETVIQLRDFVRKLVEEKNSVESEIQELQSVKTSIKEAERKEQNLKTELRNNSAEIKERSRRLTDLRAKHAKKENAIKRLESQVDKLEQKDNSEAIEIRSEINRLEYQLENLKDTRSDLQEEITNIESEISERPELDEDLKQVNERITELRSRVDRIESEAVRTFNEHMDKILDILDYDNISRIWIERLKTDDTTHTVHDVRQSVFEIHVVRTSEEGRAYEDTIDHLSESEREITGIIFALAGYLAHDVKDEMPYILLDSLEAIDSERIAKLVEYFENHAEFVVVALLPEDAKALPKRYNRVQDI